jgi:hypothetical protein
MFTPTTQRIVTSRADCCIDESARFSLCRRAQRLVKSNTNDFSVIDVVIKRHRCTAKTFWKHHDVWTWQARPLRHKKEEGGAFLTTYPTRALATESQRPHNMHESYGSAISWIHLYHGTGVDYQELSEARLTSKKAYRMAA